MNCGFAETGLLSRYCGGGSHIEQTGRIMTEFEKVLLKEKPDLVIVVGAVNSTINCSLTAV